MPQTRDEAATHRALQLLPQKLEAIDNSLSEAAATLKLIEIGLDQITTVIETQTAVLERLVK